MELNEQQELYDDLETLIKSRCKNQEFCLIFSTENGGIGSSKCSGFIITTLGNLSALGSWKGIANSINARSKEFADTYFDLTLPPDFIPVKPKQ